MLKRIACYVLVFVMCMSVCIGYAALADNMTITGTVDVTPNLPDVYISNVTPSSSAGVSVSSTYATTLFTSLNANGTATFTIEVVNISDKIYVFERVIDSAETGIEGAYTGTDVTYAVSNISPLDEVSPSGGTRTFNVTITVPRGVTSDNYILIFNFIEKTGTEILPGNDEYDITLCYNNGQPDVTLKVHADDFIPRPRTPSRGGYDFTGWYTDADCTTAWNFEIDKVKGHMTLYAGWSQTVSDEYVVTFSPNNGEPSHAIMVAVGALIPLPQTPVREGYDFIGWYRDSACTVPWNFDTDRVTGNMVLYGDWEIYVPPVPPDCSITFKPNNGEPDWSIVVLTGEFIPRQTTPVRKGYTFIGWYIDEACTIAWNFEVNRVEGHTVLYGGWEEKQVVETVEYTVTFKPNNGSSDSTAVVEEGTLIPRPPLPTREGYTFIGWYTDAECTMGWNFDIDYPTSDMTLYGGWEKTQTPTPEEQYHSDFMGLVEALLSDSNNCLNDNDLIFDAVLESLTSKKRPDEDAPILHCSVNSVSGGTMSAIATYANAKLTANLHFIFEVDPDPAYQNKRLRLYMYYGDECANAKIGDEIMVYQQIVTRGADGVWYADGTYIGKATVGNYFGGGNSGKDVKTISPYTWKWTSTFALREP